MRKISARKNQKTVSISRDPRKHVRERLTNWEEIAKSKTLKKRMSERLGRSGTAKIRRNKPTERSRKPRVVHERSTKKVRLTQDAHTIKKTRRTSRHRISGPTATTKKISVSVPVSPKSSRRESREKVLIKKLSELKIRALLGEGAFSRVYLAQTCGSKKALALKVTPLKNEINSVVSEGRVLSKLSHPFIVGFHGAFKDRGYYCILLDLTLGGEVLYHFERAKHGRFDWERKAKFYCAELVSALDYLHDSDYVYRDLKPENILLDRKGHVKLVDFGFAKQLATKHEKCYTLCGSKEYVAPEVLSGKGYSKAADIWSLGVLLFELTVGHLPYDTDIDNPSQLRRIIERATIKFPPFVSSFAKKLIQTMLILDPSKRITVGQIKRHRSMTGIDWKAVERLKYRPPIKPTLKHNLDVSNYQSARFEEAIHTDSFKVIDSMLDNHF